MDRSTLGPLAAAWGLTMLAFASIMLVWPNLVPVPPMGSATAIGVAAASVAACVVAAWRHARLAQIAQRMGPLVIAFGYILVGTSALVFIAGPPFAPHSGSPTPSTSVGSSSQRSEV